MLFSLHKCRNSLTHACCGFSSYGFFASPIKTHESRTGCILRRPQNFEKSASYFWRYLVIWNKEGDLEKNFLAFSQNFYFIHFEPKTLLKKVQNFIVKIVFWVRCQLGLTLMMNKFSWNYGGIQILIRSQKYFKPHCVVAFPRVKFAWANRIFYLCRLGQPPTKSPMMYLKMLIRVWMLLEILLYSAFFIVRSRKVPISWQIAIESPAHDIKKSQKMAGQIHF